MVFDKIREYLYGNAKNVEITNADDPSIPTWFKVTIVLGFGTAVYWFYKQRRSYAKLNGNLKTISSNKENHGILFSDKNISHEVIIIEKEHVTHDVRRFRLKLPESDMLSGILPGKHVKINANINGQNLMRFYSPVSDPKAKGHFEIVLKIYPSVEGDPKAGVFSRHLDSKDVGDHLLISGPYGAMAYQGNGTFLIRDKELKTFKHVAMIAGGTGITPKLQLIRSVIRNKSDPTRVSLIYTNKTPDDVVCREELEDYAADEKFRLLLTLTRVDRGQLPDWPHTFGRIGVDKVKEFFPEPSEDVLVLICGPKGMNATAKSICEELKYPNVHVY